MRRLSAICALGVLCQSAVAILVATDSPCGTKCGNVLSSTSTSDLVCKDSDYSTSTGVVWELCLNCESTSSYYTQTGSTNYTDLQSLLYNMRFATSSCLFGNSSGSLGSNPCTTSHACGPLMDAFQYESLATNVTAYGYCSYWSADQVDDCNNCLGAMEYGHQFINYVNILDGACKMQPADGSTLAIKGNIFSTDTVSVTTPTPTAAVSSSGPSGPLSLGGIVGVAIGGAAFILAVLGFCIVMNGKRKRRAFLKRRDEQMRQWPNAGGAGEMFETPISQRPLRSWDESPVSTTNDAVYPRYFSPYSSQFNSPVSAVEGNNHQWPTNAAAAQNIGVAISPDGNQSHYSWSDNKGKDKMQGSEDYEMQEGINSGGGLNQYYTPAVPPPQAPVLSHPGYGRHGPEPPRSLTEEDFRSGRAM
ncbi:hypothetical protein G7054_g11684 [Neopestalotiopsis clavispora]|nr:hypothetical protein G7054_g11684 [Neopestalotiopsis clavispora]